MNSKVAGTAREFDINRRPMQRREYWTIGFEHSGADMRILKVQTIFANDQGKWLSRRHGAHRVNDRPSVSVCSVPL